MTRSIKHKNPKNNKPNTLIAIPVFNEFKYVGAVLNEVHKYTDNILVIDDGSSDGTSEVLDQHNFIDVISNKTNRGYVQCLIDAFDFADNHNFDWLITIDCDFQHEPSYIPRFYSEIRKNDADIISGSRYLITTDSNTLSPPRDRMGINVKITNLLNCHLNLDLTDSFCGFKAYRVASTRELKLTESGYGLPLQLWIQADRVNLRVREIPVPLIYHDPKRNFGGIFENPQTRFDYYIGVIARELKYHAHKNPDKNSHS